MTAQMPDELEYNGETYSIIGVKGEGLFEARDLGLIPLPSSTACWRGNIMKYRCEEKQLILDEIIVNSKNTPTINGVDPQPNSPSFNYTYRNLNLMIKFTGGILIAKDFIQSMYVHMGFQRPIAFEKVIEIQMEEGNIISVKNLSHEMEKLRNKNPDEGSQPESSSKEDIGKWVEKTFSRDYEL